MLILFGFIILVRVRVRVGVKVARVGDLTWNHSLFSIFHKNESSDANYIKVYIFRKLMHQRICLAIYLSSEKVLCTSPRAL
jgi:hypothetical protein